jgi:hypothetical protein
MQLIAKGLKSDIPLMAAAIIITPEIGCASHSSHQSDREKFMQELKAPCGTISADCTDKMRKALLEERDKVLDKLCKICPLLDERPESCENCVVESVRKELRKGDH